MGFRSNSKITICPSVHSPRANNERPTKYQAEGIARARNRVESFTFRAIHRILESTFFSSSPSTSPRTYRTALRGFARTEATRRVTQSESLCPCKSQHLPGECLCLLGSGRSSGQATTETQVLKSPESLFMAPKWWRLGASLFTPRQEIQ